MIFVANGMPRSGSLLQYNIARVMLETRQDQQHQVVETHVLWDLPKDKLPRMEDAVMADDWYLAHAHEMRYLSGCFQRFSALRAIQLARQGRLLVGHTYRDLRDVAASLKSYYGPQRQDTLGDLRPAVTYHQWLSRFRSESWVLFQRYEETIQDLPAAAHAIAELLGVKDEHAVRNAAQECSMDEVLARQSQLQQRAYGTGTVTGLVGEHPDEFDGLSAVMAAEQFTAPDQHQMGLRDLHSRMFLHHVSPRRGRPESWSEVLSEEEVAMIEREYAAYLLHEGYELTQNASAPSPE